MYKQNDIQNSIGGGGLSIFSKNNQNSILKNGNINNLSKKKS
jgi:hypothetical protein